MMPKKSNNLAIGYILYFLTFWCFSAQSFASGYTAQELTQKIIESEEQIHDMQMDVVWHEPETNNKLVTFKWGFENGKEFIEGNKWSGGDKDKPTTTIKYAFDGDKQRNFRHNTSETRTTGGVYGLTPTTFSVYGTPKTLLGYSVKQNAQETFGGILSGAEELNIKGSDEIEGASCIVVEATGVEDGSNIFDIRAWIDTERSFRPLKIEKYKRSEKDGRWKLLSQRIDNIKLKKIEGVWFPVSGERQFFRTNGTPRHPKRKIDIDATTIKINQGISPDAFKISFPSGCRIWDDIAQIGYKVGVLDDKIVWEPLTNENPNGKQNHSVEDTSVTNPEEKMVLNHEVLQANKNAEKEPTVLNMNQKTYNGHLSITIGCLIVLLIVGFVLIYFIYVKRKV